MHTDIHWHMNKQIRFLECFVGKFMTKLHARVQQSDFFHSLVSRPFIPDWITDKLLRHYLNKWRETRYERHVAGYQLINEIKVFVEP